MSLPAYFSAPRRNDSSKHACCEGTGGIGAKENPCDAVLEAMDYLVEAFEVVPVRFLLKTVVDTHKLTEDDAHTAIEQLELLQIIIRVSDGFMLCGGMLAQDSSFPLCFASYPTHPALTLQACLCESCYVAGLLAGLR